MGVAAGPEKAPGVLGVLRSEGIDTAVLDVDLAREVLARAGPRSSGPTAPA
ncbi:hypothetical protein [Brachybacterium vulturis]|uniref:hypothetical protein n=1 Tax=Brachybacterium vulturis TaxID=2017484 RepID=UPI0037362233